MVSTKDFKVKIISLPLGAQGFQRNLSQNQREYFQKKCLFDGKGDR